MPRPPLFVSREAFQDAMRLLIANFDPNYPVEKLDDLEALYRRVFTDTGPLGDAPEDALLARAVNGLLDHRTDRGMPRVAELREVVDDVLSTARLDRQGREIIAQRIAAEEETRRRRDGR